MNIDQFAELAEKAIDGDVSSQTEIGNCFSKGVVVNKNDELAAYWYQKAAEQGDSNAQYKLGVSLNEGVGVEKDCERAVYWLKKAAEQDNPAAYSYLGWCYRQAN